MKPVTTPDYYTDPIVYKEGFFKNPEEEQAYMALISEQLEKEKARLKKVKKQVSHLRTTVK